MTSLDRASSPRPDRPWIVLASGVFGALTIITSGLVGSPLASVVASGIALASWRRRAGLAVAIVAAGSAWLLYGDPWLSDEPTLPLAARLAILFLCAAVAGASYRFGLAAPTAEAELDSTARPPLASVNIPAPLKPRVWDTDTAERAERLEGDVIQRFVRDARAAIGIDDVLLWRFTSAAEMPTLFATASGATSTGHLRTEPPVDALLHWVVEQQIVAANYDSDIPLFMAAPVGMGDRTHGVLAAYAADRLTVEVGQIKPALVQQAAQAALLLDLLAAGRSTQRYRARLAVLLKAAERIQNTPDIDAFGQAICHIALEASATTRAAFVLWDDSSDVGSVFTTSPDHPVHGGFRVTADSLVGTACRERQRFSIREAYRMSPEYPLFAPGEPARPISSIGIVPLIRTHAVLGAMVVEGDAEGQVTEVEGDTLGLLASVASVALENMLRLETARERASRDPLTRLPNRGVFDEQLRQRLAESDRFGQPLSLILLDIDHFKSVNDRYGHEAGDAVLVAVAKTLGRMVRTIDLCARYGGEELAVLLPQTGLAAAREAAERLREAIAAQVIPTGRHALNITASLGVSCYPESAASHDALFASADQALYEAKGSGRNCTRLAGVITSQ